MIQTTETARRFCIRDSIMPSIVANRPGRVQGTIARDPDESLCPDSSSANSKHDDLRWSVFGTVLSLLPAIVTKGLGSKLRTRSSSASGSGALTKRIEAWRLEEADLYKLRGRIQQERTRQSEGGELRIRSQPQV